MKCLICKEYFTIDNVSDTFHCKNSKCLASAHYDDLFDPDHFVILSTIWIYPHSNIIERFELRGNMDIEINYDKYFRPLNLEIWLASNEYKQILSINYNYELTIDNFDEEMKILTSRIEKLLLLV